jgi:NADPH-dependent 2,4-dienoyl-CoA reductase/sulfur reductase-like enzyme
MESKTKNRISRRGFLQVGGAGALAAGVTGTILLQDSHAQANGKWDREVDIVVVGGGAAGSAAALFAHDAKAEVVIIENRATRS